MVTETASAVLRGIMRIGLWLVRNERGHATSETIFCPRYETVVEVRGARCVAVEDESYVGSMWNCQRECRAQAPVKP